MGLGMLCAQHLVLLGHKASLPLMYGSPVHRSLCWAPVLAAMVHKPCNSQDQQMLDNGNCLVRRFSDPLLGDLCMRRSLTEPVYVVHVLHMADTGLSKVVL